MVDVRWVWSERLRQINRYAIAHNFRAGFPTFHQADYGSGLVLGNFLLDDSLAEWHDVLRSDLNVFQIEDIPGMFRAANNWANNNGFAAAFPNCEQADHGGQVYCGIIALKPGTVEFKDILRDELGVYHIEDVPGMFKAVHNWATNHGYVAGFPNFNQANYSGNIVCGAILFPQSRLVFRDIFADILMMFSRFSFDTDITSTQVNKLFERHSFAFNQISGCNSLSVQEKSNLINAYHKNIRHSSTTDATANASAQINGDQIWVNFSNLFPLGDFEISQSLIHEMMHCAGYTHPDKRKCDSNNPTLPCDSPGDNGPYFGTPPLRAEFCIAGSQSLTSTAAFDTDCINNNGVFNILSKS